MRELRDVKTCNINTSQITCAMYGDIVGTILKRKSKSVYLCHFPKIGIKEIDPSALIAFKKEELRREIEAQIVTIEHGNGAAGNRLENFCKANSRKASQAATASNENQNYASPSYISKSHLAEVKRLEGHGRKKYSEWQRDFHYRKGSVNHKKGSKRRLSASQVQNDYDE